LDNNAAGQEGTYKIGNQLQKAVPTVWVVTYPQGAGLDCQPDDLDQGVIGPTIDAAIPFRNWKRERQLQ